MQSLMRTNVPRVVTAAFRGGAGKTFITVGLVAALRRRGISPAAFKKGPDYIDAGWLGLAAGGDCYNLDSYLFSSEVLKKSFIGRSHRKDIAIVEGNRGLFDGVDSQGRYSTVELAKSLSAPVVLILDATKMTRTAAALVVGCKALDPDLNLGGVILNRVGGARHESILRASIEAAASVPVLGAMRKLSIQNLPQRHLGLLPLHEHPAAMKFVEGAADVVERFVDLDGFVSIAQKAEQVQVSAGSEFLTIGRDNESRRVRIAILRDSAFQFYYPENLEALTTAGAELVEVSALAPVELPDVDALYIGGGFPETHAEQLAQNTVFKESLLKAITHGLPVYAECGGLMYLSRSLRMDENAYPMVGVFPIDSVMERRPQGLGYIQVRVSASNPFYPVGAELTGHEFHYSSVDGMDAVRDSCAFEVVRGHGMDGTVDGVCVGNALGTYMHVHALGEPLWKEGLVRKAYEFQSARIDVIERKVSGMGARIHGGT